MKKINLLFIIAILGILFSACSNKKVSSEKINNSELSNEIIIGLEYCTDKVTKIKMDTNLRFMGEQYSDDGYGSELRICKINDTSISMEIIEKKYINGREFNYKEENNKVLLQKCGKETPIFLKSNKFTVCKREDGFTQVRIYTKLIN
ncbi:hypothetical protein [Aliarcobacter cryaerophilus]|uniref:hypothetical protein n=1 Tax=Aliarcobacter cryaerophilus TaxID=28198 RepID=UPI003DA3AFD6